MKNTISNRGHLLIADGFLDGVIEDPQTITELFIPKNAVGMSENFKNLLFHEMFNLRRITVSPGNPSFSSKCGVLYDKQMTELLFYPRARHRKAYIMPDSVTKIGSFAFTDGVHMPSVLEDVTVSKGVKEIPYGCFQGCNVWSVFLPSSLEVIRGKAFANTNLVCPSLPNGIKEFAKDIYEGCHRLRVLNVINEEMVITEDTLTLPDDVLVIVETFKPIDHSKFKGLKVMNEEELDRFIEQ